MLIQPSDIKDYHIASDSEWLSHCSNCYYSTFFHTPFWARAFEQWSHGRMKANAFVIEFQDNTKVLFPISEKKIGWIKVGISMPASTYGGWLYGGNLKIEYAESLLQFIKKKYKDLLFLENPYDSTIKELRIKNAGNYYTSVIDLQNGIEKVKENCKYYHRKNLKTAQKAGILIEATEDLSKWAEYYNVYEKSVNRWKEKSLFSGVKYNFELFKILYKTDESYRKLWISTLDDKIISGILCFYWNKHAVAWHGAGLSEFFNLRPNNLLYQHAINDACERDFYWFDCNPSGGLEGVSNFKQGLGAATHRTRIIDQRSLIRKAVSLIKK